MDYKLFFTNTKGHEMSIRCDFQNKQIFIFHEKLHRKEVPIEQAMLRDEFTEEEKIVIDGFMKTTMAIIIKVERNETFIPHEVIF
jgi:hypothetical protein